ncbi:pseudouridine synthase [Dichotomocladium elegans]|nr:pseudouridine synthase [Dichotomocladium elegans]
MDHRIEDFLVHEVDLDNNVVRLTSMDSKVIEKKREAIRAGINPLSASEFDEHIVNLFDQTFATQLRQLLEDSSENNTDVLTIDTTKEQRFAFYDVWDRYLMNEKKPLVSAQDGKVTIKWHKGDSHRIHKPFVDYAALGGEYLQFHVYKQGVDTIKTVSLIAQHAGLKQNKIGFAGTKDARGITVQAMTTHKTPVEDLLRAQEILKDYNIYIGDFDYVSNGLTLGDLKGNRFTLILRDVSGANIEQMEESLESLKANGFINYFGMQRFGTSSIMTHEVGRELIKKNYEGACDLVLKPRPGDRADFAEARQKWQMTKDPSLVQFPRHAHAERSMLRSYQRFPDDHRKAVLSLPRNMLNMYLHAYQSYVWNLVVSERIKRFGCQKPLAGEIVLVAGESKKPGNKKNTAGRRDPTERKIPKVLEEHELDQYSIDDIVYPLPGHRTVYPANEMGDLYKEILEKEGVVFNQSEKFMKDLSGDYRPMLAKAGDLEWEFLRYDDPVVPLCLTDLDRIEKKTEPVSVPGKEGWRRYDNIQTDVEI